MATCHQMIKLRYVLLLLILPTLSSCVGLFKANEDSQAALIFLTPFILAIVYTFQYYRSYNKERFGERSFDIKKYRQWASILVLAPTVILLVNFLPEKFFEDPKNKATYAELINDQSLLLEAYKESMLTYPDSLNCHVQYVELLRTSNLSFSLELNKVEELYKAKGRDLNAKSANIGQLLSAVLMMNRGAESEALEKLKKLSDQGVPFANYYSAHLLLNQGSHIEASERMENEITSQGYLKGAFYELSHYYFKEKKWGQLSKLIKKDPYLVYIPNALAEEYHFINRQWAGFIRALTRRFLNPLNWSGFLAALFIAGVWFWYVRSIDVFQRERWSLMLLTFLCGVLSPFIVFVISSFNQYELGFDLEDGFFRSLIYCVLGIGMVEEFAKIIPLLLILWFTKAIKEPYDFLLYASISALGFAFSENLLYFQSSKLEIIHGRGFISVVGHMCWSSIIAYGFVLAKFRYKSWNSFITFLVFLFIASIAHGLFDFWLIGPVKVWILSIIIFLFGTQVWWTMQNNCINNSPEFDYKELSRLDNTQFYMVSSLTSIFLLQYVLLGFQMGPATANYALFSSFIQGGYFIVFLSTSMGRFDIFPGYWEPIKVPYRITDIFIPILSNPEMYIGKTVEVWAEAENNRMRPFLPRKGIIIARRAIGLDKGWYLIKLQQHMGIGNYEDDHILIQFEYEDASLEKEKFCAVELRLLKSRRLVDHLKGTRNDISRAGDGMLKNLIP